MNKGKVCLLDIDVKGVKSAMTNGLKTAYRIFVQPPSLDVLKKRLIERGLDSEEVINRRVMMAGKEIELAHQYNLYHVFITNDDKEDFIKDSMGVIEKWYPLEKI